MRLEHQSPGIRSFVVISRATILAVLGQLRLVGKVLEFVLVGADHEAYDLVGAHEIKAVRVVGRDWVSLFFIATVGHEPALRRLGKHAIRKSGYCNNQSRGGEGISRVFLLAEDR